GAVGARHAGDRPRHDLRLDSAFPRPNDCAGIQTPLEPVGTTPAVLRARQKLGKYRILGRISSGPLADVYSAFDTIHKARVALKIPRVHRNITHEDFLREVQVAVKLRHPNILSVQNASYIDGHFVIAMEQIGRAHV